MGLPQIAPRPAAPAFLAFVDDERTRQAVRQAASHLGWPAEAVASGGTEAARAALEAAPAPAVLVVDLTDTAEPLQAMDALAEVCETATRVVAIGVANDVQLYRDLLRLGVSDYLVKPVAPEALVDALHRASRTEAPEAAVPGQARRPRSFAMIGARGGSGVTSLAVSVAWALAHQHRLRTVLLDLDLQFGAAALNLDLEPGRGLREILSNPERIDSLLIGSAMVGESDRLRILGAEEPLDEEIDLGAAGLGPLLDALSESADAVIIDVPRRLDRLTRAVLAQADVAAVVSDLSLAGMRDAERLLAALKVLRPKGEVRLIANRVGGVAGELPRAEFERGAGAPIDVAAPFDSAAANAAAQEAKPLLESAQGGPLALEIRRIAALAAGSEAAAEPQGRPSWLKRVLGR